MSGGMRLRLDPTRCGGHGVCALIAAERIELDAWGFPLVDPTPLDDRRLRRAARRAVAACPRGALSLEDVQEGVLEHLQEDVGEAAEVTDPHRSPGAALR